jgi:dipeptidase
MLPVYTNVSRLPKYLSDVSTEVSTDNLYWSSRLIGAMADHDYPACIQHIERYQNAVTTKGRRIVLEYDGKIGEAVAEEGTAGTDKAGKFGDGMTDMVGKTGEVITDKVGKSGKSGKPRGSEKLEKLIEEANDKLCAMAKEQTTDALGKVLNESSQSMKNGFKLSDN